MLGMRFVSCNLLTDVVAVRAFLHSSCGLLVPSTRCRKVCLIQVQGAEILKAFILTHTLCRRVLVSTARLQRVKRHLR